MNCPPEIATIVLEILARGLLRARAAAWAGNAERCAVEVDHVHNLPSLLDKYCPEFLTYYWEVERPSFIARLSTTEVAEWEPLWQRLHPLTLSRIEAQLATREPVT